MELNKSLSALFKQNKISHVRCRTKGTCGAEVARCPDDRPPYPICLDIHPRSHLHKKDICAPESELELESLAKWEFVLRIQWQAMKWILGGKIAIIPEHHLCTGEEHKTGLRGNGLYFE